MSSRCLEPWCHRALAALRTAWQATLVAGVVSLPMVLAMLLAMLLTMALAPARAQAGEAAPLRVCADPDNLPYSKEDGSGFENRIAALLAEELQRPLVTHWLPQRRGYVRKTLGAGLCDVFIGVPAGFDPVSTTRPYYRSGYVWVTRADEAAPVHGFDDPRLPALRIGVQLVGDDGAATPSGHALVSAGAVQQVVGYTVYGDGPAAQRMLADLAAGRLDAGLLWGPQAGYFAQQAAVPLKLWRAQPPAGLAEPFAFDIAVGVRRGDTALRQALQAALDRRQPEIDALLARYGVPVQVPVDARSEGDAR